MNTTLKQQCDLLVENRNRIHEVFKFESTLMAIASASMYTNQGVLIDIDTLKKCDEILLSKTKILSDFRGHIRVPLVCKMALSKDPENYFDTVEAIYKQLNESKWLGSEHKIMASMSICDHTTDYDLYINKTKEIFSRMKEEHPYITGDEDFPLASLLSLQDKDIDTLISEIETNYKTLKETFKDRDAIQTLSHVLSLDTNNHSNACDRIIHIFDLLKEKKHTFGTGYELAALGAFTLLDVDDESIVDNIIEADEYLKGIKGFGDFILGAKERRVYASQLVLHMYQDKIQSDTIVLSSMLTLTITLEIVLLLCLMACMSSVNN